MNTPSQSSPSPLYLIWSNEHDAWWRPESCGYTTFIESAGRYSKAEAEDICSFARSPVSNQVVPPEVMVEESVALRTTVSDPDVVGFDKRTGGIRPTSVNWAALVKDRDTWKEMAERLDKKVIEEQKDHNKTVDEYIAFKVFVARFGDYEAAFKREKEKKS